LLLLLIFLSLNTFVNRELLQVQSKAYKKINKLM